jgi:hypothetical protein
VIAAIPPREADHLIQLNSANILPLCWKTSIYGRTLATRNEDLERRRSEQLPAVAFAYLCQLAAGPLLLFYQPARLGRGIEKQHPSGFRTGALPGMRRAAVRRPVSNPLSDTWADTTTSHGRLMLTVLGGLAEFERDLIRARTGEGRARAVARGQRMGRPPKLTPHRKREAIKRRDQGDESLAEIGRSYNVSAATISRLR